MTCMRKSVRLTPHVLAAGHVKKMAGCKRSLGVPTAKIMKHLCSEVASGSDSTMVGRSVRLRRRYLDPIENESSASASSFESAPSIAASNTDSGESQSETVHDLGYILQSSMGIII